MGALAQPPRRSGVMHAWTPLPGDRGPPNVATEDYVVGVCPLGSGKRRNPSNNALACY